jgi:hypothetical protein
MFGDVSTGRLLGAVACGLLAIGTSIAEAGQESSPVPQGHVHPAPPENGLPQVHEHPAGEPAVFAAREASGTAWQPDETPMRGFHYRAGNWEVMLHGNGFLQVLHESAPEHRGATQAGSINWAMAMAGRSIGAGRLAARVMMSAEPLTIRGCGYPNLLQTGEFCDGDSIHDKQHPHDLFMELAAEFDRPLTQSLRWQVYGGLAGEPALGPPGFPHRLSAEPNPISPIVHHWTDSTHVTFGLVTAGVYGARWKAEASLFNGREPDEERYDLDLGALDSVAGRVSFAPTRQLVMQVSAGHLNDAERLHLSAPPLDVVRVTSSVAYHRRIRQTALLATTAAWGANRESGVTTHGLLLESSLNLSERHEVFGRMELNGKPAHDLHVHESNDIFTVGKLQGGYTRYLRSRRGVQPGFGGTLSAALVPEAIQPRYGGVGVGVGVFLTLRPAAHTMTFTP